MWLDMPGCCLQETLHEQSRLRNENLQLQNKIAEYLTYKKVSMTPPTSGRQCEHVVHCVQVEEKLDPGRNVTDQEKRYLQCMSQSLCMWSEKDLWLLCLSRCP